SSRGLDRFGRGYSDDWIPDSRALDLDDGIVACVEAGAGLCELASHHGSQPGTTAYDRHICAHGGKSSGRHCRRVPLGSNSRCAANRVAGMFLDWELRDCPLRSASPAREGMTVARIISSEIREFTRESRLCGSCIEAFSRV